ncbi:hypothetical protein HPB52_021841 [Rhipicephalus sanguineus]|uniref:Peptide chain release factor domain-containing protein n=1 Tax=Rhipicephalus sanguineus TaxID=34632 RepID=A0A9D4PCV6_RHISA|nr:hypothetical protein HPB52_021841 [Rhipicephalus sanguineus]
MRLLDANPFSFCFPPESEAQSPWHRVDPLSKSSIAPVALGKGDTRRQLMGYGALVVTDALPSDTGFYRCMWAGREYATYHLQVVAREPYSMGTNTTLPKEAAIMTLLLSLFPEGLPCRSALIPKVISSVLKDHWSVHMIGLCSGKGIVVVTDSSGLVEEVVDNSRGIFSLRQKILELPKRARRRTRFNSKFYQWRNGSVLLNPMVVSQLSDGRVKIDLANNLHILRAEFWDTGIYKYVHRYFATLPEKDSVAVDPKLLLKYFQVVAKELRDVETELLRRSLDAKRTKELNDKVARLSGIILEQIVPPDPVDSSEVLLELTAGVGGQEAMLFTGDILQMYMHYCRWKGWTCTPLDYETADQGGVRHASLNIGGRDVGKFLKFESGVHRVQRVPATERSGRIHTSTMAVAVMPMPKQVEVDVNPKDLVMKTKKASGPGGQHVNKTESAVQILHTPTGIMVESSKERSQLMNKEIALRILRAKLYQMELEKQLSQHSAQRKLQVGSRGRSEKIRTYNYAQDRVTDHRIPITVHNIEEFLQGEELLDNVIQRLLQESRKEIVLEVLQPVVK